MHFITITTENYQKNTIRLIRSLRLHHPDFKITVFTDSHAINNFIEFDGCNVMYLEEINSIGVKRAKFKAYTLASKMGDFIYLDSDIIVLNPLTDLINAKGFTACRDNLQACSHFIDNPRFPWASEPTLSGEKYFNSGVFFAESSLQNVFEEIEIESRNDVEWGKFTIPNKLYDNHFLCAKLSQRSLNINFIQERQYNWQGYHYGGHLQCLVSESNQLINAETLQELKLIHFAGITNIDEHIATLPISIIKIIARNTPSMDVGILEILNSTFKSSTKIDPRLQLFIIDSLHRNGPNSKLEPGREIPLQDHHGSILSIAQSVEESDVLWNNLKCGSAYLSAAEYFELRKMVFNNNIKSVLEFGAGFSSVLFHRLGLKQISLEGLDGPWLEFALINGVDARLTSFCSSTGFKLDDLKLGLAETTPINGNRLIFLDSPPGTMNRLIVADQLIKYHNKGDLYAVHDSVKDAPVVYKLSQALGLKIIEHFDSLRGLTLLGTPSHKSLTKKPSIIIDLYQRMKDFSFSVNVINSYSVHASNKIILRIEFNNTGPEPITTESDGILFSTHIIDDDNNIFLWDMPRYSLPTDLNQSDSLTFNIELPIFVSESRTHVIFDLVKEGKFWWSDIVGSSSPRFSLANC